MNEDPGAGATTPANQQSAYTPPKPWEQLNDSEKIERMREIIHSLTSQIYRNRDKTEKNRTDLLNHRHDIHGEVLQKMPLYIDSGLLSSTASKSTQEKYF